MTKVWQHEQEISTIAEIAVVLVLAEPGSLRALSVRRRDHPSWRCLPGGTIEAGETARLGAKRELAEETGLVVPCRALTFAGAFELVLRGGLPPIVALYVAPRPLGWHPRPSVLEPELEPTWSSLVELCDLERHGDFAESARFAYERARSMGL